MSDLQFFLSKKQTIVTKIYGIKFMNFRLLPKIDIKFNVYFY